MTTGKRTKTEVKTRRRDSRAPAGRRQFDPQRTADGDGEGRYGGYGQSGYCEEEAEKPGVQVDFDEEENRQDPAERSRTTRSSSSSKSRSKKPPAKGKS